MSTERLFEAIQSGDVAAVRDLLAGDADLSRARDGKGISLLLQALYHGQPEIAGMMAVARSDLDVHEAVALGHWERAEELLQSDVELCESRSPDGFTPLHLAAFFAQEKVAELLLDRGAEAAIAADNPMKVHPLHSAAAADANGICRALLEHGADPNARQQGGYTPLMTAALHGNAELVRMLLAAGADPGSTAEDGKTASSLAEQNGHREILALLGGPSG